MDRIDGCNGWTGLMDVMGGQGLIDVMGGQD